MIFMEGPKCKKRSQIRGDQELGMGRKLMREGFWREQMFHTRAMADT